MSLRLLCVVAHPDDECFAFGGALALAADRGVEVSILCLTDGQAATNRGDARSGAELGAMRRAEFAESCRILGAKHFELLSFQDGQLEWHSLFELGGLLVQHVRQLRPQVMVTFGGEGALNNHPDHTTVSAAATAAFHWAGSAKRFPEHADPWSPERLFYGTTDFFLPDRPHCLPAPWTTVLDIRSVLARKKQAFLAHASQSPLVERTRAVFEEHGNFERYALAYAREPGPAVQTDDMFAGLQDDQA